MRAVLDMHVCILFSSFLVSALAVCPYTRPQDEAMTCLMSMPRVENGFSPNGHHHPNHQGPPPGQRRRRQATEEPVVVVKEPTMPVGNLPISAEVVDHFCSENGTKMVDCISAVYEKCEGHPGLMEINFNPEEAKKAKSMCTEYHQEFKDSIVCMEDSAKNDEMQKCSEDIRSKISDQDIPPELISCSIIAEQYNCFVTHVGANCGKQTVSFLISTWRTMEPRYCTKTIDKQYVEPVNAGIRLKTGLLSTILVLTLIAMI